jgi:hypothetical protein
MAEIKFISKEVKEADLLKRDKLPISKFGAWQIEKGSGTTYLNNVLRKYLEGCELWPKKRKLFNSLDIEVEECKSITRQYFKTKQVLKIFGDMSATDIEKIYKVIDDGRRKLRQIAKGE